MHNFEYYVSGMLYLCDPVGIICLLLNLKEKITKAVILVYCYSLIISKYTEIYVDFSFSYDFAHCI